MNLKRTKKHGFIETCAASDMAFLLIIYFLVIAGFNINKGFLITLPAKDSVRLIQRDELLRFSIVRNDNIAYNTDFISIPEAENIIRSARTTNPNIAVILNIDPQTEWQRVVSFVEIVQDLQIEAFSFSMIRETQ